MTRSKAESKMGPVLIVEDDPDIAECLRYGLESAEFETRVAVTGEAGLSESLNKRDPPALILLDVLLPGMSGTEMCRRLRLEPSTRRTPIIMISAKASAADIANGLSVGADDYIEKPFSIKDVIKRIHVLLKSREATAPADKRIPKRIDEASTSNYSAVILSDDNAS